MTGELKPWSLPIPYHDSTFSQAILEADERAIVMSISNSDRQGQFHAAQAFNQTLHVRLVREGYKDVLANLLNVN